MENNIQIKSHMEQSTNDMVKFERTPEQVLKFIIYKQQERLNKTIEKYERLLTAIQNISSFCRKCHAVEDKNNADRAYMYCECCYIQGLCKDCTLETNDGHICQDCKYTWLCKQCVIDGKKWDVCYWCQLRRI